MPAGWLVTEGRWRAFLRRDRYATRRVSLARAQELLVAGMGGLDNVAEHSGFPDNNALRAAFHAELGMSPRQWLARQRLG